MIKLILELHEIIYSNMESPQKLSRISCQSILIPRKISGTFYAKNTWNLKEK
jgi:hypothetical protein